MFGTATALRRYFPMMRVDYIRVTPPTFESDRERNNFVVTLLFHHFLSPDDWVWLRQLGVELSDEEARALVFVREAGAMNMPPTGIPASSGWGKSRNIGELSG